MTSATRTKITRSCCLRCFSTKVYFSSLITDIHIQKNVTGRQCTKFYFACGITHICEEQNFFLMNCKEN